MEDKKIIELYFARDERAIVETQSKYDAYLRKVSGNIVTDLEDIGECVNDTYLGAWNAMPPTRPGILRIFLARITRNLSLKKLRAKYAQKRGAGEEFLVLDELEDLVFDGKSIDENLAAEELAKLIEAFLEKRSLEDRRIFLLRYWYFDSVKAIAEKLGATESKVKMTLKRTRDELKDHLIENGIEV